MRIVVTGSLGHISRPLAVELIGQQQLVTVISSNAGKQQDIESLGATAAIGSLEDAEFLTSAFSGADVVYTMVPPANYLDHNLNLTGYYERLGHNYAQAIRRAGVKRVINLSTIGGHLEKGSGILIGAHNLQLILDELPADVKITHMRPTSFYYNLYGYTHMIKAAGVIAANYGSGKIPWVSPIDIAAAVASEILNPSAMKVRYVVSEELTGAESAAILGPAIGKPGLHWTVISGKDTLAGLKAAGIAPQIAAGMVEMYDSLENGLLLEDYDRHKPPMGNVKMDDFAKEFALDYVSAV